MVKALLIDDELWIIRGLMKKVKWDDFFIKVVGNATDGIEGYNLAMQLKPDIIITDIRMPGIDGLDLIQKIRLNLPDCLCIILSGYDDFEYVQKALRIGAFDYILKPIDNTSFEEVLIRAIQDIKGKHLDKDKNEELTRAFEEKITNTKISKVVAYIEENYDSEINLNIVADMFDISVSYLSSAFKKCTGSNFSDYIAKVKINRAKQLLLYTDYSINSICIKVGFTEYRNFIRIFKKIAGKTPTQYRREGDGEN